MASATIAPTVVGDAADIGGRRPRPVYVVILALYIGANIGIAVSKSYHALLGFRVFQALAISGRFITSIPVQDTNSPRHIFNRVRGHE